MKNGKTTIITTLTILIIFNITNAIEIQNLSIQSTDGNTINFTTLTNTTMIEIESNNITLHNMTFTNYHYDEDDLYTKQRPLFYWDNTTTQINSSTFQSEIRFFDLISETYDSNYDYGNYTANGSILRFWFQAIPETTYTWTYLSTNINYQSINYTFVHRYTNQTVENFTIQRNQLQLRFHNNSALNNTYGEIYNNNQTYTFNNTSILIQQSNLTEGKVKVAFNGNITTQNITVNHSQYYEYNNDLTVNISEDIELLYLADWSNHFQVLDYANSPIEDVTIRYEATYGGTINTWSYHKLYGQRLTDKDGYTFFITDTGAKAVFTFTKSGYQAEEVLMLIGDEAFTRDSPYKVYMKKSEMTTQANIWDIIQRTFEDRTKDIVGVITAKGRNTVEIQTAYRTNLGLEMINLTNKGDSLDKYTFTLESIEDYNQTGNSNITLSIYIDGSLHATRTIIYESAKSQILDVPSIDSRVLNPIIIIAIILTSFTVSMVLQSSSAGTITFVIGTIIAGLISTQFTWVAIVGTLFGALSIIRGLMKE